MRIFHPFLARTIAMALPNPDPAPVITALLIIITPYFFSDHFI
ncbi:hypothetical protein ASZ90_006982 [hydrocarbon metagenome]|uniref:Uncharacterized protein n=1 Tax=hydrocarbon metagenome TaxID=938273 RepID=A0A0W8FQU3_9ZZZZ